MHYSIRENANFGIYLNFTLDCAISQNGSVESICRARYVSKVKSRDGMRSDSQRKQSRLPCHRVVGNHFNWKFRTAIANQYH